MTDGKTAIANINLNIRRQVEQPQGIGHHGATLADLGGGFFLGQFELFDELRESKGLFQRIQILALKILDQGQFQNRFVVRDPDDDRHLSQSGHLRGPPAAFSRDQFKTIILGADNQGLDNALFLDRSG